MHWKSHKPECLECRENNAKLRDNKGRPLPDPEIYIKMSRSHERLLLKQLANAMPAKMRKDDVPPLELMQMLGINLQFLSGLATGDWDAAFKRLVMVSKKIEVKNNPPLKVGDYVEVQAGNDVLWNIVGKHGYLEQYFPHEKKWGILYDKNYPPGGLVMANNLLRVSKK